MAWKFPPWFTAEWRFLTYLNYRVAPETLQSLLPPGLIVDRYDRESYVSVVGAKCLHPKWRGLPVLAPEGFSRLRLQTYVRRDKEKGVFALAEIYSVPSLASFFTAQSLWGAKSFPVQTDVSFRPTETISEGTVRFHWGDDAVLEMQTEGPPSPVEMWPDEAFFIDRYRSFYGNPLRGILAERPGWFEWTAKNARLTSAAAEALAGKQMSWIDRAPDSSFLVKGGPVAFRRLPR